jgi:hypothetical protein
VNPYGRRPIEAGVAQSSSASTDPALRLEQLVGQVTPA